jgi:hypothetical protein
MFITGRAITYDHKPQVKSELAYIKSVGGFVAVDRRVNGVLAIGLIYFGYIFFFVILLLLYKYIVSSFHG